MATNQGDAWPGEPGLGGWYTDEELRALVEVFHAMLGWRYRYDRTYQETFEADFAAYTGAAHAISVNSGGVALDLAFACLGAKPGDEVLSCAINFPGSHLAALGRGLRLVLCEPDPATLNLDPNEIPRRMTRRTRAVLVTHMNGLPADMSSIHAAVGESARRAGIPTPPVIVDAARACGAATPEGRAGRAGWITIFSFHRKKPMTTLGEGGMLTTNCADTARRLRQRRSFGHREVWGSSYRMTEFQAAVGSVQLRRLDAMNDARIELARARTELLAAQSGLRPPAEPPGYRHIYSLYSVLLDPESRPGSRDRILERLARHYGVGAVVANPPTYQSHRLIRQHTRDQGPFPIAESVADRLLCPSLHPLMSEDDNARIAAALGESVAFVAHAVR